MRRAAGYLLLAIASLALDSSSLLAEPPEGVRVARLVRLLGEADYAQRQTATDELAKLGPQGRRQLTEALATEDVEVRLRAADLLRRLRVNEIFAESRVTHHADSKPIAEVVAMLGDQTKNDIHIGERFGSFNEGDVTLDDRDQPYWQAIDEVCRQTNNRVRPHYNPRQPGLVLVAGSLGRHPVAYAGPVRAQITSARRVFVEQFDYEQHESEVTHTFQLNLQMIWEDRFRLVAYRSQPEVAIATVDTGDRLPSTETDAGSWNVAGSGIRQLTTSIRLQPAPAAARQLDELRLRWGMIAVGDMATFEIADLTTTGSRYGEDIEVVVEEIVERTGGRYVVRLLVVRDLVVPEPEEILLHENQVELADSAGRAYSLAGQSSTMAERGVRLKLTFQAPESDSTPHRLQVTYPRIRAQRDLEIVFRDVPLPVGQPE